MRETVVSNIRKSGSEINQINRQLDTRVRAPTGAELRKAGRFRYEKPALLIEGASAAGGPSAAVRCRNLSSGGAAVLSGRFIYPGKQVVLRLVSEFNHEIDVPGKVISCRYIEGSGSVHEARIRFEQPINTELFHRAAKPVSILLVDPDPGVTTVFESLAGRANARLQTLPDRRGLAAELDKQRHDLVVVDVPSGGGEATALIGGARATGYSGPIAAVVAGPVMAEAEALRAAGYSEVLPKPVNTATALRLVEAARPEPMISALAGDAASCKTIDDFSASAGRLARQIETASVAEDLGPLATLCVQLRQHAAAAGFPLIADAAQETAVLAVQPEQRAAIRVKVAALVRLCSFVAPAASAGA